MSDPPAEDVPAEMAGSRQSPGDAADRQAAGPADLLRIAEGVIADDARAVAAIGQKLGPEFVEAVLLLSGCRGKVLVAGLGVSGATARRVAHILSVAGTASLFVHAADGLHGGLGSVSEGDVLIAISRGGDTDELNEFVRRAKLKGAQVVGMTQSRKVPLGQLVDIALEVVVPGDVDPGGMIGTGSSLAASALGDALAIATMKVRGYTWSNFEFTHPAGAVGKVIHEREHGEP